MTDATPYPGEPAPARDPHRGDRHHTGPRDDDTAEAVPYAEGPGDQDPDGAADAPHGDQGTAEGGGTAAAVEPRRDGGQAAPVPAGAETTSGEGEAAAEAEGDAGQAAPVPAGAETTSGDGTAAATPPEHDPWRPAPGPAGPGTAGGDGAAEAEEPENNLWQAEAASADPPTARADDDAPAVPGAVPATAPAGGPEEAPAATRGEGGPEEPSLRAGLEAILMVVDEPVPEITLAQILERPRGEVAAALRGLAEEYTGQGRGFELREIAGGWRFYTRDVCAPLVERFVLDGQQARLTQAALETLAVVAYRQPVSRARVSAIRGVNSDGVIRTLTLRGLIEEAGHDPEHQAVLYRTTGYFLERLGLNSLDELPDLAPYLPDDVEGIEELQQ